MKSNHSFLMVATFAVVAGTTFFILGNRSVGANPFIISRPTPAAPSTPGEPEPFVWATTPALDQPLDTPEQALEQVLIYDKRVALWDNPWSMDTLTLEPGRITIEGPFASRSEEDGGWFAPEIDANARAVWRITIKGTVHLPGMLTMNRNLADAAFDGVTYVISQRTGYVLGIRTGIPIK